MIRTAQQQTAIAAGWARLAMAAMDDDRRRRREQEQPEREEAKSDGLPEPGRRRKTKA